MKLIGISLRKPNSNELTAACAMGVGLWVAVLGVLHIVSYAISKADAGALLLVVVWGCVSARCGIRVGMGQRHLFANLLVSALLLGLYEGARAISG